MWAYVNESFPYDILGTSTSKIMNIFRKYYIGRSKLLLICFTVLMWVVVILLEMKWIGQFPVLSRGLCEITFD